MQVPNYHDITHLFDEGLTLEAREKILTLREAVMRLQEENLTLKQQLQAAEASREPAPEVYFKRGLYWRKDAAGGEEPGSNGPFCQVCYDTRRQLIRLTWHPAPPGNWVCGACLNQF